MSVVLALHGGDGGAPSLALYAGGKTASAVAPAGKEFSSFVVPALRRLLARGGLGFANCDAFAFAAGPGRFSALRQVCAFAKALAYSRGKALVAVPSLAVVAARAAQGAPAAERANIRQIKCAIAAHRDHLFFAVCRQSANGHWQSAAPRLLAASGKPPARKVCLAGGGGFVAYPQQAAGARLLPAGRAPAAVVLAQIAVGMLERGQTADPLRCEPIYGRKKIALTTREREALKTGG